MSANDTQVAGEHYKRLPIQPWDYIAANGIGYFEGCAIKYLTRWRGKGGVEDLRKARHFIEKLIELETPAPSAADKACIDMAFRALNAGFWQDSASTQGKP